MDDMSLGEEAKTEIILNSAASEINNKAKKTKSAPKSTLAKWVEFVNNNSLAIKKEGKTYLKVEAWNYLFSLKGLSPTIIDMKNQTNTVEEDGDTKTDIVYIAKAGLIPMTSKIDEEIPLGATVFAGCKIGENDYCNDYYSAMSMAQTRAIGKLGRTVFGHLAVACGFQATPFEELPK